MNKNNSGRCTTPIFKLNVPDDSFKIQPLPRPVGKWPYRLQLSSVVNGLDENKMVFHMVGDTGSAKQPRFQRLLAGEMKAQVDNADALDKPCFLFHLGDVVYHFGEAEEYYRQFFEPYRLYPGPVFAIAGNHDSDVNPGARKPYNSLDAFTKVFCDTVARPIDLAEDTGRLSNIQPNIYYTLQSPLATFICLYSNVPKFGYIDEQQQQWFVKELQHASTQSGKAIIVCIHHAPYSADANHGSSRQMITFLEGAFALAGVWPHLVCSGHVHNYQRFSRQTADGKNIPYIVAGAGGYVTLFPIVRPDGINYTNSDDLLKNICLETYCDYAHGFLKVSLQRQNGKIEVVVEYFILVFEDETNLPLTEGSHRLVLFDKLEITV